MAYDQGLAERVREYFHSKKVRTEEKKMFGGLGFMVDNKMCIGVHSERLTVRVHPDATDRELKKKGVTVMEMRGKQMRGYMFVSTSVVSSDKELQYWLGEALEYNKEAKSSKKPVKKPMKEPVKSKAVKKK